MATPLADVRLDRRIVNGPAMLILGGGSVALCIGLGLYSVYHRIVPADLEVYLLGAHHSLGSDLYRVATPDFKLPFTYPPFAALVFVPLAVFPFDIAKGIWAIATVAALVASIGFSIRFVRPELDRALVWRWALALSLPFLLLEPVFRNVTLGQVNIALLFPVLWDLGGFRRAGPGTLPAGVATGLTAAVKLVPLIFIPYLLLVRRTKAGLTCAATFAVASLLAFAVSPSSSWQYWSKDVLDTKRFSPIYLSLNQSIYASLGRLAHEQVSNRVGLGASALVGILGLVVAVWAGRRSSPALGLLVAGAVSMLASPVTWTHHMVWVIPIVVWLSLAPDRPPAGRWIAAATVVLFWIGPVADVPRTNFLCPCSYIPELHENAWQLLEGNSYFFATLIFVAGVAVMVAIRQRPNAGRSPRLPVIRGRLDRSSSHRGSADGTRAVSTLRNVAGTGTWNGALGGLEHAVGG